MVRKIHTILLENDGTFKRTYDDDLDISSFKGTSEIRRASLREYNNETKQWEATIKDKVICSSTNKNECDALELEYLNNTNLQELHDY